MRRLRLLIGSIGFVEEKKPKLIYAPSIIDNHCDHRATNRILRLALEPVPKEDIASGMLIRGYEIWTPLPANRMVDISSVEALKRQAINFFASQTRFVDYTRAILGLNQYRSMMHLQGRSTAEGFGSALGTSTRRLWIRRC